MATIHWEGKASPVAQVTEADISTYDVATTYTITIGGVAISQIGVTDADATAAALVALLNASTHPYFAAITWSVSGSNASTVVGTADTAGVPFTFVTSDTGGTGVIAAASDTTANVSPNDWNNAENWSGGVVPVSSDDVIIKNSTVSISWGLDQSAVDLDSLDVQQSMTGTIGLNWHQFATSSDGATVDTSVPEYRDHYLKIGATVINIGQHIGGATPAGSARIKIDNDKAGASDCFVHNTAAQGQTGLPAVRYLAANASAHIEIREAPGGFGVAIDEPNETSTIGNLNVVSDSNNTNVFTGGGVTMTNYYQRNGTNIITAAATVTLVEVDGGDLRVDGGDYLITTMTINGGDVIDAHESAAAIITTCNLNGGGLDLSQSSDARTITTLNMEGGELTADNADVTISSVFLGSISGIKVITVSEV